MPRAEKKLSEMRPDENGKFQIRVSVDTIRKIDQLASKAEGSLGFTPTRAQIVAGLVSKALNGGDNA